MKKTVLSMICVLMLILTLFPVSAEACVAPVKKNGLFKPRASQAVKTSKSIKVKWSKVSNAKGYIVRYKPAKSSAGYKKKLLKGMKKNSIVLKGLKKNREYIVKVTPFKYKKKKRVYGPTETIKGYTYLSAPKYYNFVATANKIGSNWINPDSEARLEIARASSYDGPYKTIKKAKGVSVTDNSVAPGGVYYYKVRSYKKYSKKVRYSKWSSPVKMEARNSIPKFTMKSLTPDGYTDTVILQLDADEYNFDTKFIYMANYAKGDLRDVRECHYSFDGTDYTSSADYRADVTLPPGGTLYLKYVLSEKKQFTNTGRISLTFENDYTKHVIDGFAYITICLTKSEVKAEFMYLKRACH